MGRFLEISIPWLLALIVPGLYLKYGVGIINIGNLLTEFQSIGTFTFGFLLTLLGLIHQGDSEAINAFKSHKGLYGRFISLNRNTVFLSLILTLYSYTVTNIHVFSEPPSLIDKVISAFFLGGLVYFAYTSIYFLLIFYKILKIDF